MRITRSRWAIALVSVVVSVAFLGGASPSGAVPAVQHGFNQPGDILIADQFNNRVIEVNRDHQIVWQFGVGPNDFSARSIIGVNDAQRVGPFTLMAGTGDPARRDTVRAPIRMAAPTTGCCSWVRPATSCGSTASS